MAPAVRSWPWHQRHPVIEVGHTGDDVAEAGRHGELGGIGPQHLALIGVHPQRGAERPLSLGHRAMHRHIQPARGNAADLESSAAQPGRHGRNLAGRGRVETAEGSIAKPVRIQRTARHRPGLGVSGSGGCVAHPEQHLEIDRAAWRCRTHKPPGPDKARNRPRQSHPAAQARASAPHRRQCRGRKRHGRGHDRTSGKHAYPHAAATITSAQHWPSPRVQRVKSLPRPGFPRSRILPSPASCRVRPGVACAFHALLHRTLAA